MKIIKLNENLIKQIAAGEVIGHPSNALKELIENAIDAESSEITIYINKSGLEKIIVIDNGSGINCEDLKICTQLHTTSKTSQEAHIFGTHSLGFRGEALASIDAIADLTISSNNYKIFKNEVTPSNVDNGTKIEVNNMFANLPGRLKFLKNSNIEWNLIKQTLQKYIIKYNNINWEIFNNDKKFWAFKKTESEQRIKDVFSGDFVKFEHCFSEIEITGYIMKTHKNTQYLYVNNRPIKDKAISGYINSIFKEFFMKHENPSYVLFIKIDPFLIDCNVNPTKEEVRFISYTNIFSMLSYIFSPDLFRQFHIDNLPNIAYPIAQNFNETQPDNFFLRESRTSDDLLMQEIDLFGSANHSSELNPFKQNYVPNFENEHSRSENFNLAEFNNLARKNFSKNYNDSDIDKNMQSVQEINIDQIDKNQGNVLNRFRIIGQIKNSFVIFETEHGMGVFDQHAAHERAIYEQIKTKLDKKNMQKMMIPPQLEVNDFKKDYIINNLSKFANKGIIIENMKITYVPMILSNVNLKEFLENEITENVDCDILIDRLLADVACKNALKANTQLSTDQCYSLLESALKNPPICNHGRPIFKYFSTNDIINWFKR